jgi:hypothetical protein
LSAPNTPIKHHQVVPLLRGFQIGHPSATAFQHGLAVDVANQSSVEPAYITVTDKSFDNRMAK